MSCFPCCSFIRATLSQSARIPPWTAWLSTCPRSGGNGPPTLSSPSCPTSNISNRGRIYRRWRTSSQDLHRSNITTVDSLLHSRFQIDKVIFLYQMARIHVYLVKLRAPNFYHYSISFTQQLSENKSEILKSAMGAPSTHFTKRRLCIKCNPKHITGAIRQAHYDSTGILPLTIEIKMGNFFCKAGLVLCC